MALDCDLGTELTEAVRTAFEEGTALAIQGSGSKRLLGRPCEGTPLDLGRHRGIVAYEPGELFITARAGTPLAEIESTLAAQGQMLAFEPPHLGPRATLGGTLACGLSGPRRPYAGSARDFVLGCTIVNGRGERLRFGGRVMKNVAGYDVSRLMVGAQGTLGVLLEITLKVLPMPERECTQVFDSALDHALTRMNRWAARPLPLSAAAWMDGQIHVRLSGNSQAVTAACQTLGGAEHSNGTAFWGQLRERRLAFFVADTVWRISVPPAAPPLPIAGRWLLDWGGAQRWLVTDAGAESVYECAYRSGGYAMRHAAHGTTSWALPAALDVLQRRVKAAFDPRGILNPQRL